MAPTAALESAAGSVTAAATADLRVIEMQSLRALEKLSEMANAIPFRERR